MKKDNEQIIRKIVKYTEWILYPFTFSGAITLQLIRRHRNTFKRNWEILKKLEVVPITNHYYEPLISKRQLSAPCGIRDLKEINFNIKEQLEVLKGFDYADELKKFQWKKRRGGGEERHEYFYNNKSYGAGDSEYLYSVIRKFKPKRIIEIGSGFSTLMSLQAIEKNKKEDGLYDCEMICIEPYEQTWLTEKKVTVIRKRVEEVELSLFCQLESQDILFIDSSHVIRPQGDVLFEYQKILPVLKEGVFVHIHNILTPRDYPEQWIFDEVRLWNEQYLLEAFLMYNNQFKIIGALNYLFHSYP